MCQKVVSPHFSSESFIAIRSESSHAIANSRLRMLIADKRITAVKIFQFWPLSVLFNVGLFVYFCFIINPIEDVSQVIFGSGFEIPTFWAHVHGPLIIGSTPTERWCGQNFFSFPLLVFDHRDQPASMRSTCNPASVRISRYACPPICRSAGMQVSHYAGQPICGSASSGSANMRAGLIQPNCHRQTCSTEQNDTMTKSPLDHAASVDSVR